MIMEILNWDKKYAEEFEKMNLHWLNEFFYVEPHDEEVLGNYKQLELYEDI